MKISVTALDVGFDVRVHHMPVSLEPFDDPNLTIAYSTKESPSHVREVSGTRDECAKELARHGYTVIACKTPNGDVRCEPKKHDIFVCQPANDNYWLEFPTIASALAGFETSK